MQKQNSQKRATLPKIFTDQIRTQQQVQLETSFSLQSSVIKPQSFSNEYNNSINIIQKRDDQVQNKNQKYLLSKTARAVSISAISKKANLGGSNSKLSTPTRNSKNFPIDYDQSSRNNCDSNSKFHISKSIEIYRNQNNSKEQLLANGLQTPGFPNRVQKKNKKRFLEVQINQQNEENDDNKNLFFVNQSIELSGLNPKPVESELYNEIKTEIQGIFQKVVEQQIEEIRQLKQVVISLVDQVKKYKKRQKYHHQEKRVQEQKLAQCEKLIKQNFQLKKTIQCLQKKLITLGNVITNFEEETSEFNKSFEHKLFQMITHETHTKQLQTQTKQFSLCFNCLNKLPKPFALNNADQFSKLHRQKSCTSLLETQASSALLQQQNNKKQQKQFLKNQISIHLLKRIREKQKKINRHQKQLNIHDPFNPIIAPPSSSSSASYNTANPRHQQNTKPNELFPSSPLQISPLKPKNQTMSYHNILPKKAYLLQSPNEDQKGIIKE